MELDLTPAQQAFRLEVQQFLESSLTPDLRQRARETTTVFADYEVGMAWQRRLHARGWLDSNWPAEYGGPGWGPIERYVFETECARASAPSLSILGLRLLAPVLMHFGTPEQNSHYLPKILSGEHYWCQGFSEPGAGSDLASLRTRAERVGDSYVINGSKIWTTHAQFANRIFCLVRTDPVAKAQKGITFLLVDMKQPGVEVRPIMGLAGDHEVNAVFFDDVKVPAQDRVGEEGQGWTIAKFLLQNERGGSCLAPQLLTLLAHLRSLVSERMPPGSRGREAFLGRLAHVEFKTQALEATEIRILSRVAAGHDPGPQSSLVKLVASDLRQAIEELRMDVFGSAGLRLAGDSPLESAEARIASASFLNSLAWTIFGGTNEVQRTIIARAVLQL